MTEFALMDDTGLRAFARRLSADLGEDAYHDAVCQTLVHPPPSLTNPRGFWCVAIKRALAKLWRHEHAEHRLVAAYLRGDPPPTQFGLAIGRALVNRRRSQCRRGHALSEDNLAFIGDRRTCRTCKRAREAQAARATRAARKESVMQTVCRMFCALVVALCLLPAFALAETLTWNANTEADLAGYKVYRSTTSGVYGTPLATLGKVTTYTITLPAQSVGTTYFMVVTAYDVAGNESGRSNEVSKFIAAAPTVTKPGIPILTVSAPTASSLTVSYPTVSDGAGGIAKVDIRYAVAPALTNFGWGSAPSATCTASPCVITGLAAATKYETQAVAYRPGVPNVYGTLSAVVSGTTLATANPPPAAPGGLQITKNTLGEIIIVARVADCLRVATSTLGSTATIHQRTVTCLRS